MRRGQLLCSTSKTATGYELVGAMYTMPKLATEDQLNERVPLSIASGTCTRISAATRGQTLSADYTKFGLHGSIATQEACDAAGGNFIPRFLAGWSTCIPTKTASTKSSRCTTT